ncbi:hypothetical protein P153DRAFT_360789 [Dothidotthia symphoricarpi CBS 119687]|uniref:Uncharacterized protein n=1 Tax=Dothidotthia symphoricarpi CBS 119687 TaxID=1392245 RepID=A0A6A6A073_9PLEO|nr:uncharacterized protein P153DRAFT_360789 [Dothidotthia symphoricarpi CBS 119687]KAF2125200.1 hypothetical protein P153DRAFT_360789 [Dothidotthia symphoricarpi CBS 119687]
MNAPPPLTIEEVLMIFLLIFEVAVYSLPTHAVSGIHISADMKLIKIWYDHDAPRDVNNIHAFPPGLAHLAPVLAKKDLCDTFCALMGPYVQPILQELFGATVRVIQFIPRPALQIIQNEHDLQPRAHTVLEVTMNDGRVLFMDGTSEQFGWDRDSTWLRPMSDVVAYHMHTAEGFNYLTEAELEEDHALVLVADQGYWVFAAEKMEEAIGELDWEVLREMVRNEREEYVKALATAKFQEVIQV